MAIAKNPEKLSGQLYMFDFDDTLAKLNKSRVMGTGLIRATVDARPTNFLVKMREVIKEGHLVYIITARPMTLAHLQSMQAFLKKQGIDFPAENIFMVGENSGKGKAEVVDMLMREHRPEKAYFYDDYPVNISAIKALGFGRLQPVQVSWFAHKKGLI